ncbi:hypothetical protein JHK85_005246 [Glycine max]|nr:hypothetical protein JHK85_005246 [Glycine max]KAG5081016.1 hypothetical protein JHK86_005081 [Glycine max]
MFLSFTYDMFLNFRGSDTRFGFTGNLYKALHDRGFQTFIDDEKHWLSMRKAIISNMDALHFTDLLLHYFCMIEFQLSEDLMLKFKERRSANGYESKFIERIVEFFSTKINRAPLHVADYPVGLEAQVLEVKKLFDIGTNDGVHMIGIHGIGGIGKSTLAGAVYNSITDNFDEILGEKKIKLASVQQGIPMIKHRLQQKKVLLILDDVDKHQQLHDIVGRPDWFGPGSRIIITTHGVKRTYEEVLDAVVTYASGLPLALEVIGSNLFGKSLQAWKSSSKQYKRILYNQIVEILKVSFDALGDCMKNHTGVLVEKSLIKHSWDDTLTLHDLVEDMGKELVKQDIIQVLEDNTDKEMIEWNRRAFKKMKNLKTLIIKGGNFSKDPKYLPNSLRVLKWWRYPSCCLPSDFHPKKLAICKLPYSSFTSFELDGLWKKFVNLKVLNFDWGKCLTKIPDNVYGLSNLEELAFKHCKDVVRVHNSIGFLDKLQSELSHHGDFCWRRSPLHALSGYTCYILHLVSSNIRKVHDLFCHNADKVNNFSFYPYLGCLHCYPWFAHVKVLKLSNNNFTILPEFIKECQNLLMLSVCDCKYLQEIRGIPPNLKHFFARKCKSLTSLSRSMFLNQDKDYNFFYPVVFINGNKCSLGRFDLCMNTDHTYLFDLRQTEFTNSPYEVPFENEWNHAVVTCLDGINLSTCTEIGIHIFKHENFMEDIRFTDPYSKRKLDNDLYSLESQNHRLLKKHRFVDMEDS